MKGLEHSSIFQQTKGYSQLDLRASPFLFPFSRFCMLDELQRIFNGKFLQATIYINSCQLFGSHDLFSCKTVASHTSKFIDFPDEFTKQVCSCLFNLLVFGTADRRALFVESGFQNKP